MKGKEILGSYVFGDYVLTPCQNVFNEKTSFWLSKEGYTTALYCWSSSTMSPEEMSLEYAEKVIEGYIRLFIEKFEMPFDKIFRATAYYTGGGIYAYYGTLDNGQHFITSDDWEGTILITDEKPEAENIGDVDWQEQHGIIELYDHADFMVKVIDWILTNKPVDNYDDGELQHRLAKYRK